MTDTDIDDADMAGFTCYRPGCHGLVMAPISTATPLYCTPACAESADEEYAAAKERVEHLRGLLLHSRYWVAAFGRGDPGPTEGPEQAARAAVSTARGTLQGLEVAGGPRTDRERFLARALTDLAAAVGPLVEDGSGGERPLRARSRACVRR